MGNQIVKYQGMNLDELSKLPEDKLLDVACDMVRAENHEVRATSERVMASLARMDAMDKMADLDYLVRQSYHTW